MSMPVWIVPHTHWDREWYRSFQYFRVHLVDLVDALITLLERDPGFSTFMLDGQMAVVDDYLEIRPHMRESLERLAREGRLTMGPWYILMDEFLVSGETIIRNLQLGIYKADQFAGHLEVGYLPDMFGHIAQMPQILSQAGLSDAVVWRGVPSQVNTGRFRWTSPDGSSVIAQYLIDGYGNGSAVPKDPEDFIGFIEDLAGSRGAYYPDGILLMNGTDHQKPKDWLSRTLELANQNCQDFDFRIVSLEEVIGHVGSRSKLETASMTEITGELRSSARANLLMGVASNRVDVKKAASLVERELERRAEPLVNLFSRDPTWAQSFLDSAWKLVIENSAHDSICACSVDEVVNSVLDRFSQAREIARALSERVLGELSRSIGITGASIINTSHRTRGGLVVVDLPGTEIPSGCQLISSRPPILLDTTLQGPQAKALIGEFKSQQIGSDTYINSITCQVEAKTLEIRVLASDILETEFPVAPIRQDIVSKIDSNPDKAVHILATQPPVTRVASLVDAVPGFGYRSWKPKTPEHPVVQIGPHGLSNGLVSVELDPNDGTFSWNGHPGFDQIVDEGDHGDTYNFSPPQHDVRVSRPDSVSIEFAQLGPVKSVIRTHRLFSWPERIDETGRARTGQVLVDLTTELEIRADDPLVRITTRWKNESRDHRVRTIFPLITPAYSSQAECAFCVVERPLSNEGGPTEVGLATYPSRRFVSSGAITVFHQGLLEYELVSDDLNSFLDGRPGPAYLMALTLLRATGFLSRVEMSYRPLPAGPPIEMDGSQMLEDIQVSYALASSTYNPYELADSFLVPLDVVVCPYDHDPPNARPVDESRQLLKIDGCEVSSITRDRDTGLVTARMFNPTSTPSQVTISNEDNKPCQGSLIDLLGRSTGEFTGSTILGPHKIQTVRLFGL